MTDIFSALKPFYLLSKIIGPNFYKIETNFGVHKIKINKTDLFYFVLKFVFTNFMCVLFVLSSSLIDVRNFKMKYVPKLSLDYSHVLIVILIYIFEIKFYKKIFNIYCTLDELGKNLNSFNDFINYFDIRTFFVFYFVGRLINFSIGLFSLILLHVEWFTCIFFVIAQTAWLLKETELCLILYISKKIAQSVNNLIISKCLTEDCEEIMKGIFKIHSTLFDVCKEISSLFSYLVVYIFLTYSSAVFTTYSVLFDTEAGILFINCTIQWTCYNYFGLIYVIYRCVSAKTEVGMF